MVTTDSSTYKKPKKPADTPSYEHILGESFLSIEFWANNHPLCSHLY